jgi:hypothetical protein
MHDHHHNLKTHNMSKLLVMGLSIILITGISLVPTLQIGVQGQVQQQAPPAPPSPGGSPSSGTSPPPALQAPPAPPSPGGSPSSGTSPPPPAYSEAPPSPGGSPSSGTSPPPPALDTADGGAVNQTSEVANQTGGGSSGAVNQTAMVMIPQSSVMTMIDNLQTAMDAVADDEDAVMAIQSVDQELKSAANASGISIETTTTG